MPWVKTCANCEHSNICKNTVTSCEEWLGWIPVESELPEEKQSNLSSFFGNPNYGLSLFKMVSDPILLLTENATGKRTISIEVVADGKFNTRLNDKLLMWRPLPKSI